MLPTTGSSGTGETDRMRLVELVPLLLLPRLGDVYREERLRSRSRSRSLDRERVRDLERDEYDDERERCFFLLLFFLALVAWGFLGWQAYTFGEPKKLL